MDFNKVNGIIVIDRSALNSNIKTKYRNWDIIETIEDNIMAPIADIAYSIWEPIYDETW